MAKVEVRLQKKGPSGGPHAQVLVPSDIRLENLIKVQKTILRDHLPDVGLKPCEGCLSGLHIDIGPMYEKVITIEA
jgi:hypothetical protein